MNLPRFSHPLLRILIAREVRKINEWVFKTDNIPDHTELCITLHYTIPYHLMYRTITLAYYIIPYYATMCKNTKRRTPLNYLILVTMPQTNPNYTIPQHTILYHTIHNTIQRSRPHHTILYHTLPYHTKTYHTKTWYIIHTILTKYHTYLIHVFYLWCIQPTYESVWLK